MPTPSQAEAQRLYDEGWRITSRRGRTAARLPPGETGEQAYSRATGIRQRQGEQGCAKLYRAIFAEREGYQRRVSAAVMVELARIDSRVSAAVAIAEDKQRKADKRAKAERKLERRREAACP